MQVKNKTVSYLYFDEKDRNRFRVWLIQENLDQNEVAKRLNVSTTYFSLILTGKRVLTDKIIKGLEKLGYEVFW